MAAHQSSSANRFVLGCALVVPQSTLVRNRELIAAHPGAYPFPAWVAASREDCRAWVEGVVATSGPNGHRSHRH